MSVDRTTLLFLDAACLVAAAGSASGGSAFLLALCQRGFLRLAVSQAILSEAWRNVGDRMGPDALHRLHLWITSTPLEVVRVPVLREDDAYWKAVGGKDAHVLAAAVGAAAPYLITLDKPLARRVNASGFAVRALSPGEFIRELLPAHPDYPRVR